MTEEEFRFQDHTRTQTREIYNRLHAEQLASDWKLKRNDWIYADDMGVINAIDRQYNGVVFYPAVARQLIETRWPGREMTHD